LLDGEGPVLALLAVVQYDFQAVVGVPLGLTDVGAPTSGAVVFLTGAEASPDAVQDGPVAACRVGLIDGADVWIWDVFDERAEPVRLKLEDIKPLGADGGVPLRFGCVAAKAVAHEPHKTACRIRRSRPCSR
jgi:hypothetical protein